MLKLRRKIRLFALYSRLFIFTLQFVCNLLIPDHDAKVFTWNIDPEWRPTIADRLFGFLLDGLIRWDGHHFLHIATQGYTFEQNLAFFPLFPLAIRLIANVLFWMQEDYGVISYITALKISSVGFNLGCFLMATEALYDLSRKVLKDEYLAYKAGLFFAINPASIFFSAPYSESLNSFLTFYALNKMSRSLGIMACLLLALASFTRANSILNAGFVIYRSVKIVATETILYVRLKKSCREKAEISTMIANILGDSILPGMFNLMSAILPFFVFQWFSFTNFCRVTKTTEGMSQYLELPEYVVSYARANLLKLRGDEPSPWCKSETPFSYFYVQEAYWNNGFLAYWELKQLPNFLLALPAILLVLSSSYTFMCVHWDYVKRLGLVDNNWLGIPRKPVLAVRQHKVLPRECFVYVVHASALAIFAFFFMNVQVVTRLILSASPIIPWLAALLTTRSDKTPVPLCENDSNDVLYKIECKSNLESNTDTILFQEKLDTDLARWIMMFFLGYFLIGTILFSNHLPWT